MEFELSRRNGHHYFKKSYYLFHSRDGASTREEIRHHGRSGERKETVGRRGSWALTQDRLHQDYQATHWKMNISPLAILWTSYQKDCFFLVMNYIPHSSRTFRQKRGGIFRLLRTVYSWFYWTLEILHLSSTPQCRPMGGACSVTWSGWKQNTVFQSTALHSALPETQSKEGQLLLKALVKSWIMNICYFQTTIGDGQSKICNQQHKLLHYLEHGPLSGVHCW